MREIGRIGLRNTSMWGQGGCNIIVDLNQMSDVVYRMILSLTDEAFAAFPSGMT